MIWVAISWYSAGPVNTQNGQITASEYVDILGNQVYLMAQMFPNNDAVFQDDSSPMHTTSSVQFWFEEHEDTLYCLPWPAQSADLHIIEPLWSVVESTVRAVFLLYHLSSNC